MFKPRDKVMLTDAAQKIYRNIGDKALYIKGSLCGDHFHCEVEGKPGSDEPIEIKDLVKFKIRRYVDSLDKELHEINTMGFKDND